MINLLIWSQVVSLFFYPFVIGVLVGMYWSMKVLRNPGPPFKVTYETDTDPIY